MAKITPTVRQTFLAFGEYIFGSIGGKTARRKGQARALALCARVYMMRNRRFSSAASRRVLARVRVVWRLVAFSFLAFLGMWFLFSAFGQARQAMVLYEAAQERQAQLAATKQDLEHLQRRSSLSASTTPGAPRYPNEIVVWFVADSAQSEEPPHGQAGFLAKWREWFRIGDDPGARD